MNKATNIKDFLIENYELEPHHFEVDIERLADGSTEFQERTLDISELNIIFDSLKHAVRTGNHWFSVSLITNASNADTLIHELNIFLEQIEEEQIELQDNVYISQFEGLNDFLVRLEGGNILISLAWRIE